MHKPKSEISRLRNEYLRRKLDSNVNYNDYNYFYMIRRRQKKIKLLLNKYLHMPISVAEILEVGCGNGCVLQEMINLGASPDKLTGIDILDWRLKEARRCNSQIKFILADAQQLPFKTKSFDIILQFTAFSSILDYSVKKNMAYQMVKVLDDHGFIVWYDFWLNPTNKQTKGIRINEIKRLFPGFNYDINKITLAPPITKILSKISIKLCDVVEHFGILNTHYLVIIYRDNK